MDATIDARASLRMVGSGKTWRRTGCPFQKLWHPLFSIHTKSNTSLLSPSMGRMAILRAKPKKQKKVAMHQVEAVWKDSRRVWHHRGCDAPLTTCPTRVSPSTTHPSRHLIEQSAIVLKRGLFSVWLLWRKKKRHPSERAKEQTFNEGQKPSAWRSFCSGLGFSIVDLQCYLKEMVPP